MLLFWAKRAADRGYLTAEGLFIAFIIPGVPPF